MQRMGLYWGGGEMNLGGDPMLQNQVCLWGPKPAYSRDWEGCSSVGDPAGLRVQPALARTFLP